MDHRCLYGHRVSESLVHALRSRICPTCGAATVSLAGYQAARTLAREGGFEAVAAFNAVRLLERDWVLAPADEPAPGGETSGSADAVASVSVLEDVDVADADAAPRVRPVARPRTVDLAPGDVAFFKED